MDVMNQLHPYDHCEIRSPQTINSEHQKSLQLCYQPILGIEAVALYLKLWVETQQSEVATCYHRNLLDALNFNPRELLQARITLEAVGLLKTFEKPMDSFKSVKYILRSPLVGTEFFTDSILSVALLRKIGKEEFAELRKRLTLDPISLKGYEDVSRSFNDVFITVSEDELKQLANGQNGIAAVESQSNVTYPFEYDLFDFKGFMLGMGHNLIPSQLFTLDIKITIAKLAFLYNYSVTDMQRIVLLAWNTDDVISKEVLEKCAEDHYQLNVGMNTPKLLKKHEIFQHKKPAVSNEAYIAKNGPNLDEKESLIHYLDTTSPIKVFEDSNGYLPSEMIVFEFNNFLRKGVSYGVLNTLIQYISMSEELSYNANFMQVVINNWLKKGATSASDTIEIANKEHNYRLKRSKNLSKVTISKNDLVKNDEPVDTPYVDFKNSTPYQYLKMLNGGNEPFKGHVKIAENLYHSYNIPIEVVNVIIDQVWHKMNGNLPESFVESLASEIRYNKIEKAEDAVSYIDQRQTGFVPKVTNNYLVLNEGSLEYDKTIPYEFLKKLYKGQEPVKYLIELVENLVLKQGMPIGVVNVLVEYAFMQTNGKITKNFVQAIAGNWMMKQPKNASEAIDLIENDRGEATSSKQSKITMDTPLAFKVTVKDLTTWLPAYDEVVPYEFMKTILNGKEPLEMLVKMSDDLVLSHGMKVGVVNVILEYVLTNKRGRVGRNQIQSLALNMQLQNILFAKEALNYIESYYINQKVQVKITQENLFEKYPKGYLFSADFDKYEKATPYEFIKLLNDGQEPFAYIVDVAEKLILQYKMSPAITNFMLEYVMEKTDGALPEKYINSVANTWRNNKIQTISQAQQFIEQSERKNSQKPGRKVGVVPDWFKNKEHQVKDIEQEPQQNDIDFEEERRKLLEKLNRNKK